VWVYAELLALRLIDLHPGEAARALLPSLSASIGMAGAVMAVSLLLAPQWPGTIRLLILCLVGIATFVAWAFLMHRDTVVSQLQSLRAAWSAT
jgi:hypothetical protein